MDIESYLKVLTDPSHTMEIQMYVPQMALAAPLVGADGI